MTGMYNDNLKSAVMKGRLCSDHHYHPVMDRHGKIPGRSSRGDGMMLRWQSVVVIQYRLALPHSPCAVINFPQILCTTTVTTDCYRSTMLNPRLDIPGF